MAPGKKAKLSKDPSGEDFRRLGAEILGRRTDGSTETFDIQFLSFFGVDELVCALTWQKLEIDPEAFKEDRGAEPSHLLWALLFLKLYTTMDVFCRLVGPEGEGAVDPKTFRKWSQRFVEKISCLSPDVVSRFGCSTAAFDSSPPFFPNRLSPAPLFSFVRPLRPTDRLVESAKG
jgi:hypothetical protein